MVQVDVVPLHCEESNVRGLGIDDRSVLNLLEEYRPHAFARPHLQPPK